MVVTDDDKSNNRRGRAAGFAPGIALGAGAGVAGEWKTALVETFLNPPAGSIALVLFAIVVIGLIRSGLSTWRSWQVIFVALLVDYVISIAVTLPLLDSESFDPLTLWPYVLTALATVVGGVIVGLLAPFSPYRHASCMVCIDLVLAGTLGLLPLSITLISRVVTAFLAAWLGVALAVYWKKMSEDPLWIGKVAAVTLFSILTSVVGGVGTALALELFK